MNTPILKEISFEVYTVNPNTGETGWDIKFVNVIAENKKQAKEYLKKWPLFDCIILFDYERENKTTYTQGQIVDIGGHRLQEYKEVLFNSL